MSTLTISDLTALTGVTLVTDYADEFAIPVSTGMQRQGDVLVIPDARVHATTPVEATGCPVVRGENGGNTHAIYAEGRVFCDVAAPSPTMLRAANLTVTEGAVAYLGHPEHGYMGVGPGSYVINRQRQFADEIEIVAD